LETSEFQAMVMKGLALLDKHITESAGIHNKQMKTINGKLADALRPPFVYSGIVKEQFHLALKKHVARLYNEALDVVVSEELDHTDPNRVWPAGDDDPEKSAWPVTKTPFHFLLYRCSHSVSVFIVASVDGSASF
jgi:hypothetical protein